MSKRFVKCIYRWFHRIFYNRSYRKIAQGLANCLVPPHTKEQKKEREIEALLYGVPEHDKPKIIEQFKHLSREIDPLKATGDIPPDSVKSTKANISNSSDGKKITFEDNRTNRKKRH